MLMAVFFALYVDSFGLYAHHINYIFVTIFGFQRKQERTLTVHLVGEPREWSGFIPDLESGAAPFQILILWLTWIQLRGLSKRNPLVRLCAKAWCKAQPTFLWAMWPPCKHGYRKYYFVLYTALFTECKKGGSRFFLIYVKGFYQAMPVGCFTLQVKFFYLISHHRMYKWMVRAYSSIALPFASSKS